MNTDIFHREEESNSECFRCRALLGRHMAMFWKAVLTKETMSEKKRLGLSVSGTSFGKDAL